MKLHVRPSRPVSIVALFVSGFLILFGLGFLLLVGQVLDKVEAPALVRAGFYLFMLVWIGAAIAMAVYHVRNVRQGKGGKLLEIGGGHGGCHRRHSARSYAAPPDAG